jgi:hypothetical protein
MRKLSVALGLVSLLFCLGCGSSNRTNNFVPRGNFSNASLNGQYVYEITGTDFSFNPAGVSFSEAGVFTADGNGHITTGIDDFTEGSSSLATNPVSGSYSIASDGTGRIALSIAPGSINLAVTLVSSSRAYLIDGDSFANAGGIAEKQDPTAIAAIPTGTFTFRLHNVASLQGPESGVGAFTVSGGTVTGSEDVNRSGAFDNGTGNPLTLLAGSSLAAPGSNGRGTGTFIDSAGVTSHFVYYIVNAGNLRLLSSDSGTIGLGRAEKQNGTLAFSGSYAFGSKGDTNFVGGVNTVGVLTANNGSITAGTFDAVQDGNPSTDISITSGSYTPVSNGRTTVTFNGTIQDIVWLVSPARAFFLVNDSSKVEDGTLDLQSGPFSNSTMNGQFAFVMDGFDPNPKDRVGTLQWDGSGNLTLNEFVNAAGLTNIFVLPGTYSVSSNGRTTAVVRNLSSNLVFYLISGTDAYLLQNDTAVEVSGTISKQP